MSQEDDPILNVASSRPETSKDAVREEQPTMLIYAGTSNTLVRYVLILLQVLAIVCCATLEITYKPEKDAAGKADPYTAFAYGHLQDVQVMIFVGFGFLMTFLQDYNWSALGFNFLLGAVAIEWYMLVTCWLNGGKLLVNYDVMFNAEFAAAAVLISFGAILGKVNHLQLVIMALIEILVYKVNERTITTWAPFTSKAKDMGGSMIIHVFGAYFGLAVSRVLYNPRASDNAKECSKYHTDIFSMIGTIFLWMYWPSFNSIEATGAYERQIVAINTWVSLAAACITTFALTGLTDESGANRIDMVHIQNATLAGGVAMGSSCNFHVGILGAIIIGSIAGAISTLGYQYLQEFLEHHFKIQDTCGVNNLHGMPGIMGCIFSVIFGLITKPTDFAWYQQFFALGLTLSLAIGGGIITGMLMKFCISRVETENRDLFEDSEHWMKHAEHWKHHVLHWRELHPMLRAQK